MGGAGGMGGTGGMGGMGGGPSACPTLDKLNTQIEVCSFITNGPTEENGLCCYTVYSGNCCGRPFLVAGQAELAPVAQRDDWLHVTPSIDAMGEATRRALAAAWLEDARMEHASIASFARFTMHLLALGAPASLVEAAQRAGLDEVAHARACFGLAARYAGEPLGPARLPVEGALVGTTLRDAAVAAVVEGCIGETTAAFVAAEQCSVAQDEAAREALVRIAQDEAAHAELAWRFVAWALREGGEEVRRAVREAFVRSLQTPDEVTLPLAEGVDALAFRAHGRLLPEEAARARRDARSKIIAPSASRLLEVCPVTVVQAFI